MDKEPKRVVCDFSYKKQHFLTFYGHVYIHLYYFKICFVKFDVVELNDFWSKANVEVKGVNLLVVLLLDGDTVAAFTIKSLDKKKIWKKKL